jgi:methionyl-tRNA synthetase
MLEKYCDSHVPKVVAVEHDLIDFLTKKTWPEYANAMETYRFDRALEALWKYVAHCDQLISDRAPWTLAKQGDTQAVNDLLYHLAESLRHIAVMLWPLLPETAEKIFSQLGLAVEEELAKPLDELQQWVDLTVGNKINKGEALFPRLN